ncbi:hypothetical protein [Polaromonas sp. JS666]|uniref:hypothetical protein n=1 Tax=Polaromonas sp. (strain JS666 / ATCC BAA-500) TaxID=296591 RepID=UPI00059CE397|nr:hypothetical protein [Polaromonas sp. JS666]
MTELPRLDPDEQGNAHLQDLVRHLHPDDVAPFVEKLATQPLRARFHTYRELLLGVHIREGGADFRYERMIDGQTPDWSLLDDKKRLLEVIDVLTLHQRSEKEREITTSIRSTDLWTGWITIPPDHIYRKLSDKAGQYAELARNANAPYVLAVYGDFIASLSPEEIEHVLYVRHGGWFNTAPEVSGLIYFREKNFQFEFNYFSNPVALHQSTVVPSRVGR